MSTSEPSRYTPWPNAFRTSRADPRFPYCAYLPSQRAAGRPLRLLVLIHGSERDAMGYRDSFTDFAEANHCAVLAPLFPVSPLGDGNGDGYKYLAEGVIRYDLLLLAMVAEFADSAGEAFDKFALFGFSGGGHFVHRFFYLHAERLAALSIGAPGGVTLIEQSRDWWQGTGTIEHIFGRPLDLATMRRVPVQMVIGAADNRPLAGNPASPYFRAGDAALGPNRQTRLQALFKNYREAGIAVEFTEVPEAGHEGLKIIPAVQPFLQRVLAAQAG